jgi:hypothetical protein
MNSEFQHQYIQSIELLFIIGLILSSFLSYYLYKRKYERFIASLPLLSLFAHQVEEYVLSPIVLGDQYHFLNWAYRIGMDISPTEVVTINAPGWIIVGSLLLFKSKTHSFSKLFLLINSILIANAAFHLGVSTSLGDFSPGMITSLFMYLPLFLYAVVLNIEMNTKFRTIFILSVSGFVIHFILLMRITVF